MGWWDDLTWGVSTAFNTYKTLYENPKARRELAGRAIDEVNKGNFGDRLADAVQAGAFLSGANANDLPPVALELVRAGGNAANAAVDFLPAIGAVKAGISTGANALAGRDPQLEKLFAETALAFAPSKVSTAATLLENATDLPAVSALIKKEQQQSSPKAPPAPEMNPKPVPQPSVLPEPKVAPRIQPEVFSPPVAPASISRSAMLNDLVSRYPRQLETTPFTLPKPHYRVAPKKRKRKL
jgi:hypothetical protein